MDRVPPPALVAVFGSVNLDFVVVLPRLPRPGETVTGGRLQRHHGGKGGNQAVAARRAGAAVRFIGAVGDDAVGDELVGALDAEGIDTAHTRRVDGVASGTASICVDTRGENQIAVAPGANRHAVAGPGAAAGARVALAQMEAEADAVIAFLDQARAAGAMAVLNAAPFVDAVADAAEAADLVIVNADERDRLGPVPGTTVVTTLGAEGLVITERDGSEWHVPGHRVDVVDTVGAGDAVCGTLAAGLAHGLPLVDAARRANAAGALATTGPGARSSPTAAEIDALLAAGDRS
jgi:ribokinase